MTIRFWIGVAAGAAVAWVFFAPRNGNGGGGVGGPQRPRGQAGYSGFSGRWRR